MTGYYRRSQADCFGAYFPGNIGTIDQYRRAASYVDRILKGENTGELPVQYPVKFELLINLRAAQALGLTFPSAILADADEVIE